MRPGRLQSARGGRPRHQQVRTDGRIVCRETRQMREGVHVGAGIVDICNEASKQNRLYSPQRNEAVAERKFVLRLRFGVNG